MLWFVFPYVELKLSKKKKKDRNDTFTNHVYNIYYLYNVCKFYRTLQQDVPICTYVITRVW